MNTDYHSQSLNDVIADIREIIQSINDTQSLFQQNLKLLESSKYLDSSIPNDFKIIISSTVKIFETSIKDLKEILNEVSNEIRTEHITKLNELGLAARKLSNDYGIVWHQKYSNKEYGDQNFRLVEGLYSQGRDELNSIVRACDLADRLKDLV